MAHSFWKGKKVLVTGGTGFIGSHVAEQLIGLGACVTVLDNLSNGVIKNIDVLKDRVKFIRGNCTNLHDALLACKKQDVVMNLAARVGGIEYNRTHQGTMLSDNLAIVQTMIEAARQAGVGRFLVVSSACVYPHDAKVPTPESEGFQGEPESTNGGYGWAKRMGEKLGMYYAQEFGMKVSIVRPYNAYGPRDHFDPNTSHVIPALIKRVMDGENPITVWGSGKQTRAFLYVDDLARGMIQTIEHYPEAVPVNLGTDEEVSISHLVHMIIELSGRHAKVIFDTSKPDGSPRRNSDNTFAEKNVGFKAKMPLRKGLTKTLEWYKQKFSP